MKSFTDLPDADLSRLISNRTGDSKSYAADLNAAFTLVEKLKGDGWGVHIYRNPPDKWRIDLQRYAEDQWPFIEHPSLARAICLAFLAVTER